MAKGYIPDHLDRIRVPSAGQGGLIRRRGILPLVRTRVGKEALTSEAIRPDGVVIREISPTELRDRIQKGDPLVLLDVREPFERLIADLPAFGQIRIPVKEIPSRGPDLDLGSEIVVYCRSGPRSAWAVERLMDMGFPRVLNLRGGLMAWKSEIDPTVPGY